MMRDFFKAEQLQLSKAAGLQNLLFKFKNTKCNKKTIIWSTEIVKMLHFVIFDLL